MYRTFAYGREMTIWILRLTFATGLISAGAIVLEFMAGSQILGIPPFIFEFAVFASLGVLNGYRRATHMIWCASVAILLAVIADPLIWKVSGTAPPWKMTAMGIYMFSFILNGTLFLTFITFYAGGQALYKKSG